MLTANGAWRSGGNGGEAGGRVTLVWVRVKGGSLRPDEEVSGTGSWTVGGVEVGEGLGDGPTAASGGDRMD